MSDHQEAEEEQDEEETPLHHSSPSSSSFTSKSSSTESDLDGDKYGGKFAATCSKKSKKVRRQKDKKLRIATLMGKAIQGHFDTFKPAEVILKGVERGLALFAATTTS